VEKKSLTIFLTNLYNRLHYLHQHQTMEVTMTNKQTKLTNHKATMIAEGAQEPDYPEQYIEAWQHLINTGLVWQLQGFFGRTAQRLISDGICTMPKNEQ
jgi:hypothetical protein